MIRSSNNASPARFRLRDVRLWTGLGFALWANLLSAAEPFPGTQPLEIQGDLADLMVQGIDRFLLKQIDASVGRRPRYWKRDFSSAEKYDESVAENRKHLAKVLGAFDPREPVAALEYIETTSQKALIGRGETYEVYAVRWPVLRGVTGEGLLLVPTGKKPVADVVAVPDADQTPERVAGLVPGVEPEAQFARRLVESGCRVVVPMLIDRADTFSVAAGGARPTNQPHREFIYRQAFEMGRHIIGYEVQKILAAVDWFAADAKGGDAKIGVFGYAEGGLLALAAAALDTRIDVTCVSGYFAPRERVWAEPIYRNVFALLDEFGDAELASLIAPRALIVENSVVPKIDGPPAPHDGRGGAAPGAWQTPKLADVTAEIERARKLVEGLKPAARLEVALVKAEKGEVLCGRAALGPFLKVLAGAEAGPSGKAPSYDRPGFKPQERLKRQLDEMTEYTQHLMREGEYTRRTLWSKASRASVDAWRETSAEYRKMFADEVIGRFEIDRLPPGARSRKVYDEPKYTGYDVVLDVFPDVIAYGILLIPKDIKQGEQRPVVVCQHGLEGRPQDVADPKINSPYYNQFAIRLAEQGFITFSPQNPYIFTDRFRTLQRKSNPLRKTLFSTIVPQHQQITDWLASLPMVDAKRIGFYGLSYGGKSAMRIPALVERYCLSICSADFNEWIWKNTSARSMYSYVGTGEYEIFEFDLGNTFNYAEMAGLICPRPFMVERGHHDGVAPDEWVAYEFAKVRLLYSDLKIPEKTTIEFFDGPHTIHGVGTFAFLHQHLDWPEPAVAAPAK
ncbi:MAG TPA: dienelactone hydrolase family protein [Pirellulales bacterium]|nr:dienelactone hydrolase family protein [Pirellulales bacterium]